MRFDSLTKADISKLIAQIPISEPINEFPTSFIDKPPKPAAVILPLLRKNDQWHLLFIRRAENDADRHSGQVAFPGGAREPIDTSIKAAALREAHEEIGLDPNDVQILGQLQDFITISNFLVTPFIGVIPWPYPLSPSPEEVVRVFTIPVHWLARSQNHTTDWQEIPGQDANVPVIYYDEYDGEVLWGVSARFTIQFLEAMTLV